jgi:phosphoenolpyruvate-protein kinase (PTS system EI component)
VKHALRRLSVPECEELARLALACPSPTEIHALSRAMGERCYPELFE